jgi:hypothetical protein
LSIPVISIARLGPPRNRIDVGRAGIAAIGTEVGEADIVEQHDQDVGPGVLCQRRNAAERQGKGAGEQLQDVSHLSSPLLRRGPHVPGETVPGLRCGVSETLFDIDQKPERRATRREIGRQRPRQAGARMGCLPSRPRAI